MEKYQQKIKELEILQSMSRKGNCLNNSPTENFFVRIKEEMFYDKECLYKDIDSLIRSINKYIEYYNEEIIVNKFPYELGYVQNKIIGKTKIIVLNIIRVTNPWSKKWGMFKWSKLKILRKIISLWIKKN